MPVVDELLSNVSNVISSAKDRNDIWFTKLDLNYAFSQLPLSERTSKHCNFNLLGVKATGTYRFKTGFYGLTDMPTEFQKAIDRTLGLTDFSFCILDDILIATAGSLEEHNAEVDETPQKDRSRRIFIEIR